MTKNTLATNPDKLGSPKGNENVRPASHDESIAIDQSTTYAAISKFILQRLLGDDFESNTKFEEVKRRFSLDGLNPELTRFYSEQCAGQRQLSLLDDMAAIPIDNQSVADDSNKNQTDNATDLNAVKLAEHSIQAIKEILCNANLNEGVAVEEKGLGCLSKRVEYSAINPETREVSGKRLVTCNEMNQYGDVIHDGGVEYEFEANARFLGHTHQSCALKNAAWMQVGNNYYRVESEVESGELFLTFTKIEKQVALGSTLGNQIQNMISRNISRTAKSRSISLMKSTNTKLAVVDPYKNTFQVVKHSVESNEDCDGEATGIAKFFNRNWEPCPIQYATYIELSNTLTC